MKHGRPDYARIQDPAADFALLEAYKEAIAALRAGVDVHTMVRSLDALTGALAPMLEPVIGNPPANPISVDEPVFLLRAADGLAPRTVREYARYYRQSTDSKNLWLQHELILDVAGAMEVWQNRHGHKLPDVPTTTTRGGGRGALWWARTSDRSRAPSRPSRAEGKGACRMTPPKETRRACPICGRRRQKDRPVCGKHWRLAPAPIALAFLEALGSHPYDVASPSERILATAQRVADVVCEILGREKIELNPTPDAPGSSGAPPAPGGTS